ncbi:MAG: phosphomannomutase/phosphoglucomutase [Candidatus Eisenbacteria bacterium]|nr:phosphomannomutase/phosphoglucomutase [Candidatus Eisenbacteria bacterium]
MGESFLNPLIFRQYDVRGIAETDLNDEAMVTLGKAYGTYMGKKGLLKVSLGRDVRPSSERISRSLKEGVLSCGCDVIDIGIATTPLLYFSIVSLGVDGGMMVTGSHNPRQYNGVKLCQGLSSIYGEELQVLRKIADEGSFSTGSGRARETSVLDRYVDEIKNRIVPSSRLKVGIDCGNGTGGPVAERVFGALKQDVIPIFFEPDGRFPNHLPDPTVDENMRVLSKAVVDGSADLGVGFDGDADRIGAVDERGRMVRGDQLLAIFAKDVLSRKKGAKIVLDVKCSQGLVEEIEKWGGIPIMSRTGHAIIKARMKEEGAPVGGELSGHMFFADSYYGFDDGIYAAARLVEILSRSGKRLSLMVDEIPHYFSTPEIWIDCSDEEKFEVIERLKKFFSERYKVIDIDGARVIFEDGWGLVRASNTQPVLVLRFEAKSEERLAQIESLFRDKVRELGGAAVKIRET